MTVLLNNKIRGMQGTLFVGAGSQPVSLVNREQFDLHVSLSIHYLSCRFHADEWVPPVWQPHPAVPVVCLFVSGDLRYSA
jgi:hypothetical protein